MAKQEYTQYFGKQTNDFPFTISTHLGMECIDDTTKVFLTTIDSLTKIYS